MIEVNENFHPENTVISTTRGAIAITPPLDAEYFIARVPLAKDQALVIFPKFFTIGCGFAREEDWNTNLPLAVPAEQIYDHIKHNKRYSEITDEQCISAIRELQQWWKENAPQEAA